MRTFSTFFFCCTVLHPAHSQEGVLARPPVPEKLKSRPPAAVPTGGISGTVFCADTHRPARGVLVMVERKPSEGPGRGESMGRVAMDGSYSFEPLVPGEYAVIAAFTGYLSAIHGMTSSPLADDTVQEQMWKRFSEQGSVTVGTRSAARLDLELQRGASVSGHILYSDGSPATQITVEVEDVSVKPRKFDPDSCGPQRRRRECFPQRNSDAEGR